MSCASHSESGGSRTLLVVGLVCPVCSPEMPLLLARDAALEAIHDRPSLSEPERRALASLPEQDRELLRLRVVEERPYRDIAVRLRCTPQAARHRVSRLLRQLQYTLGGQQP